METKTYQFCFEVHEDLNQIGIQLRDLEYRTLD